MSDAISKDLDKLEDMVASGEIKTFELFTRMAQLVRSAQALQIGEPVVDDSVLKLAELMRGLEIPPAAVTNNPQSFYVVGRAIADQAKANAPQPVPKGWIFGRVLEEGLCKNGIRIDSPKDAHAIVVRLDRLPSHHPYNLLYDLAEALLSVGKGGEA